jgi:hypothetical protein
MSKIVWVVQEPLSAILLITDSKREALAFAKRYFKSNISDDDSDMIHNTYFDLKHPWFERHCWKVSPSILREVWCTRYQLGLEVK